MPAHPPEDSAPPKASPRARRSLRGRALAASPGDGFALVVAVFYLVEASLRKTPWVFTDELEWTQLSRAIAATGHAARRGQPIFFKSIYTYLIAPAWWIHSTATAYSAIKALNALVMCLTALPAYLLARMLCPRRASLAVAVGTIAIPAMSYATSIIPEPLAYLWFGLAAWLTVRALATRRPAPLALAAAAAALGPLVRKEFVVLPASALLAAAGPWALEGSGPSVLGSRLRRTLAALAGLAVFGFLFNWLVVDRIQRWTPGQYLNRHTLAAGGLAAGALAVGLGVLPVIGGLASLALPERRADPAYRAFAAYLSASILTFFVYTAAKVTFLTGTGTLVEERNLFFLSPLLLVGTALALGARRLDWRLLAVLGVLVMVSVWSPRLEVGVPYFEAPGLAILTLLNRSFDWTVQDMHIVLACAAAVSLALLVLRGRRGAAIAAVVLTGGWMLTGEIYATIGNLDEANQFAATLPPPRDWVDRASGGAGVTFLGQALVNPNQLWLTEFWNRSLDRVASIDGSAPGPGPALVPALIAPDGTLGGYTGNPYTLAGSGVVLQAPVVGRLDGYTLYRTPRSWRLLEGEEGVDSDGWMTTESIFTYHAPGGPGILRIDISRTAYNGTGPPGKAKIEVGTVRIDSNGHPQIERLTAQRTARVPDGKEVTLRVPVAATPVTVQVYVTGNYISIPSDPRLLGAQVSFSFSRTRGRPRAG